MFDLGFWYRHTRFLDANSENFSPQDAFVVVIGIEKKQNEIWLLFMILIFQT